MAASGKAEHTYYAEIKSNTLKMKTAVSITMSEIDPVRVGDSYEFFFWKNECVGEPVMNDGPQCNVETTWKVTGCISKVAFGATVHTGTDERRLSSWNEAVSAIEAILSSIYVNDCIQLQPKSIDQPLLTMVQKKTLVAIFFKLVYTREEILDRSVPYDLDENVDVANISEDFSGFQLNLRTSKNKAVMKLSANNEAAVAPESFVAGGSSSGISTINRVASAFGSSGSPTELAGPFASASTSAIKHVASAFASELIANTPACASTIDHVTSSLASSGSPTKHFASPSTSGKIKQVVSALASRKSPNKRVASPSASRSPMKHIASTFVGKRRPVERVGSPSRSPVERVASAFSGSPSRSPVERVASAFAGRRSPVEHVGSPSRSPVERVASAFVGRRSPVERVGSPSRSPVERVASAFAGRRSPVERVGSPSRSPVECVVSAFAGRRSPVERVGSPSRSPADRVASAFAGRSPVDRVGSPSRSPVKLVASAFAGRSPVHRVGSPVRSPIKRVVSVFASRSPFERIARPSATRSPNESSANQNKDVFLHGVVSILQDERNKTGVSLYSLDRDIVKFLTGRFGCGKIKELQYVNKRKARDYCKEHNIIDPFK